MGESPERGDFLLPGVHSVQGRPEGKDDRDMELPEDGNAIQGGGSLLLQLQYGTSESEYHLYEKEPGRGRGSLS